MHDKLFHVTAALCQGGAKRDVYINCNTIDCAYAQSNIVRLILNGQCLELYTSSTEDAKQLLYTIVG